MLGRKQPHRGVILLKNVSACHIVTTYAKNGEVRQIAFDDHCRAFLVASGFSRLSSVAQVKFSTPVDGCVLCY